jgi:hypothetical protein
LGVFVGTDRIGALRADDVCLVILGKYVPALEFFDVLLGDERVLESHVAFYQRLTAMDQDEAGQLVLDLELVPISDLAFRISYIRNLSLWR